MRVVAILGEGDLQADLCAEDMEEQQKRPEQAGAEVSGEKASNAVVKMLALIGDDGPRTEVSRRPGSPKVDRHEMSSLPNGMIVPGICVTGNEGTFMGTRVYTYCRRSCGCISAVDSANMLCFSDPASITFSFCTFQPSTGSRSMRSNHNGSWVRF